MVKHHSDLINCLKQPGYGIGKLCEKCEGKCPICDTYVKPLIVVKICNDCSYGSYSDKCILCGDIGKSIAYYCKSCVLLEKDRDGCPRVLNIGSSRSDIFYEKKNYGFSNRYA